MKKIISLAMAGIMAVTMLAGCGSNTDATDNSLQTIKDNGKLVLGLDDSFPPMGYRDENHNIVGFDIDVATAVCEILGVEMVAQPIEWSSKEQELNTNMIDCIWNGMSVTPEREESMSMSIPYMENHMALVVKPDSGIESMADMAGKKLALQSGSSAEDALNGEDGEALKSIIDGEKPLGFKDNLTALLDLDAGGCDAVLMDDVVANYLIKTSGKNLIVLNDFLYGENYAIGFRKGDTALTEAVNEALRELKANGKLAEIATKWFGSDTTIVE